MQLYARLMFEGELLGTGMVNEVGEEVSSIGDRQVRLEVLLDHAALRFVQEHSRQPTLPFELEFYSALYVRDDRQEGGQRLTSQLERNTWHFVSVRPTKLQVPVARSDWVNDVLKPLGTSEYVSIEMPLPGVPERERWETALEHLEKAQDHFRSGNDASVLQSCYAAFESLEGAPRHVFDGLTDERERKAVDSLLKQAKGYFHSGRHVSKDKGPQEGRFPVDHRDAEFSLYLSRVFLSYIAKLLVREP